MPDECNEVLVEFYPSPSDIPYTLWLFFADGISRGVVYDLCDLECAHKDFDRIIADPDAISEYRTVALKVYKETSQGNAQGFQMRWEFVADLDVYHND